MFHGEDDAMTCSHFPCEFSYEMPDASSPMASQPLSDGLIALLAAFNDPAASAGLLAGGLWPKIDDHQFDLAHYPWQHLP
jgi:hypothetical protein